MMIMTLAENELSEVRSVSGIIPGAKYPEGHLRRRGIKKAKMSGGEE
jgi:hypothetical protein